VKEGLPVLYEFAMTPELFDASVANTDGRAGVILVEQEGHYAFPRIEGQGLYLPFGAA
jgi:hypothetical protein